MTNSLPIPKGGKRKTRRWIQDVVGHMKQGAFTKQAARKHLTPEQFATAVGNHPTKFTLKTRRRAQFLRNVRRKV
jgi:hypothetical protein